MAGRKPQRGGVPNVRFVLAPVEQLPTELTAAADQLSVLLPWGSLLRAVWQPDCDTLLRIRALCRERAQLEVVVALDPARDHLADFATNIAPKRYLLPAYRDAGFEVTALESLDPAQLKAVDTTWAKKLAPRPGQTAWRLTASAR